MLCAARKHRLQSDKDCRSLCAQFCPLMGRIKPTSCTVPIGICDPDCYSSLRYVQSAQKKGGVVSVQHGTCEHFVYKP